MFQSLDHKVKVTAPAGAAIFLLTWVAQEVIEQPPVWALWGAIVMAALLLGWSAYWTADSFFKWLHPESKSLPLLVPFLQFLDMAIASGWPPDKNDRRWIDFKDRLREAARNEWVHLWGRPETSQMSEVVSKQPREPIPAEHWRDFEIEYLGMLTGIENLQIRSYNPKLADWGAGKRYRDLHIQREDAAAWLAKNKCE